MNLGKYTWPNLINDEALKQGTDSKLRGWSLGTKLKEKLESITRLKTAILMSRMHLHNSAQIYGQQDKVGSWS